MSFASPQRSPQLTRLDKILSLVQEQEERRHEQVRPQLRAAPAHSPPPPNRLQQVRYRMHFTRTSSSATTRKPLRKTTQTARTCASRR